METRKVQQLGPSTLAMTLPADWTREHAVGKGDEVSIRASTKGPLTVLPDSTIIRDIQATIRVGDWSAKAVERAVVAQYVLGRRIIIIENEDTLDSEHINAVYDAETQLMGLGVIEETPDRIAIRCSVDPEDFTLDNLLERLENTGRTMRGEAITAFDRGDADIAQRALNRERQANKIFVLLLRLIFSAHQNPALARGLDLETDFPLIGYRSIAKNLELTADNAEDIADIVLEAGGSTLNIDDTSRRKIIEFNEQIDAITALAVQAAVDRDYELTVDIRDRFHEIRDREQEILTALPEMTNEELLKIREILVSLKQTAEYAMRNAEIAANLALDQESDHVTLE